MYSMGIPIHTYTENVSLKENKSKSEIPKSDNAYVRVFSNFFHRRRRPRQWLLFILNFIAFILESVKTQKENPF